MCGRCTSCFMAIGSTVYVLTTQTKKTLLLEAYELKKLGIRFSFSFSLQLSFDVWDVCVMFHVYRINCLCFDPPNKIKKLNFWKPMSWKSCFQAHLDDRESESHSIYSNNFRYMCVRCATYFMDIGSTVCVLKPPTPKTKFFKAYKLKKVFSCIPR